MADRTCFTRDELREYLLGELPDGELSKVAEHLEACSACEATVSQLDLDSDTLIEALRSPVQPDDLGSAYRLAARRVATGGSDPSCTSVENKHSSGQGRRLRDYELLEPLARGGMGAVFRARHVRLNRVVALKVLPSRWLADSAAIQRFQREMQAVGALKHPAIVQATDGGEVDGVHFLVMELIEGVDGAALVRSHGPLPIAAACEIARQAALGMAYVHEQGIIHRDLKPSNLMVTANGEVKVLDLGLARIVGESLAADELTTVGQLMGTLDYMAPEQLENSHGVDERADIYSLGATLYKLIAGCTPHGEQRETALWTRLRKVALEPITPLSQRRADVPEDLATFVESMLARDAAQRPATMHEVAAALAKWSQSTVLVELAMEAVRNRAVQSRDRDLESWQPGSEIAELLRPRAREEVRNEQQLPARRVSRGQWIAAAFLLVVLGLCGVVITLQWNSGQLVIETATPDVEVRVLRAGQPYRQLTLKQLANSFRLGAGDYEIEIVGPADGLEIENGRYTLKRGETWLARITEQDDAGQSVAQPVGSPPPTAGEPRYEDRTLSQWLTLLREERSPDQIHTACRALDALATGDNAQKIAAALLEAMRHHRRSASASNGQVNLADRADSSLNRLDRAAVSAALAVEFHQHHPRSVEFGLTHLQNYADQYKPASSRELISSVEHLTSDADATTRTLALNVFAKIGSEEVIKEKLLSAFSDSEVTVQLQAARLLIDRNVADQRVIDLLRIRLIDSDLRSRAEAARLLGKLGSAAKDALPELNGIINSDDEAFDESVLNAGNLSLDAKSVWPNARISLRDAAILAAGELGEISVTPDLISAIQRLAQSKVTTPAKQISEYILTNTIEKLTELRPEFRRASSDVPAYLFWTWHGRSLSSACSALFEQADHRFSLEETLETVRRVLPRASEYEKREVCDKYVACSFGRFQSSNLVADDGLLPARIEIFKLFAEYHDMKAVIAALLKHADVSYSGTLLTEWEGTNAQLVSLAAYRDAAVSTIRSQPEHRSAVVDLLLQEVDRSFVTFRFMRGQAPEYLELSVLPTLILAELLPEADADKQLAIVERVLIVQGPQRHSLALLALDTVQKWLAENVNKAVVTTPLKKKLRDIEQDQRRCEALLVGMIRVGLADAELLRSEVVEPVNQTRLNYPFFRSVMWALRHQPGMGEARVAILQRPDLTFGEVNQNYRAKLLPTLIDIPPTDREVVRPYLESLRAGPDSIEAAAAKQVLEAWQQ